MPVALALSLPAALPFREELQVTTVGVAVISTVVRGLLVLTVPSRTGLAWG